MRAAVCGLIVSAIILAVHSQSCGRPKVNPRSIGRIIDGVEATPGSWPWIVHLDHRSNPIEAHFFGCAATVISCKFILSAAHCFRQPIPDGSAWPPTVIDVNADNYIMRLGQHRKDIDEPLTRNYRVKRIVIHELYSKFDMDHDIAVIEVDGTIEFNDRVMAACLPAAGTDPAPGQGCLTAGWDITEEDENDSNPSTLLQIPGNIVDRATCNKQSTYNGMVKEDMFCAAGGRRGQGICNGDSGGPLVCKNGQGNYVLEGIVSWSKQCSSPSYPGVFTRTGYYINWINQKISQLLKYSRMAPR